MITKEVKGDITLYTITNNAGARVVLSSLGAGIAGILVPDREGRLEEVTLSYPNPMDYMADGPCAGKTPGRFANRIADGHLVCDGKTYQLAINNGPNALHGGPTGFQNRIWDSAVVNDNTVEFSRVSADGEENYPGNLKVKVQYSWDDENRLTIRYSATTDAPTVINLTNHAYFNLGGHNSGTVLNHLLRMNCSRWLPQNEVQIPTGEYASVEGTPMDFRQERAIGKDLMDQFANEKFEFEALKIGKGYDHCWVMDGYEPGKVQEIAVLTDPKSGRVLTVSTDQPGAQVYTGNWVSGCPEGKDGYRYNNYDAVAIECQGFPDAPNKPMFPSQSLNPGEEYKRTIVYAFSTK